MEKLKQRLSTIVQELDSREWEKRFVALQKMQGFPSHMVEGKIIDCLSDQNDNVKYIAARILGQLKSSKAVPELLAAYSHTNSLVRLQIAEALGAIGDSSLLEELTVFLKSETDNRVRATLLKEIGKLGDAGQIDAIAEFLNDDDERVRANAVEALELLGDEAIVPKIEPFLSDQSNRIRANVARIMLRFDRSRAISILSEMLKNDNEWMRASACFVIGNAGETDLIQGVVNVLGDPFWVVNRNAIRALREFGEKALPMLAERMNSCDTPVEALREILRALGEIGNESVLGIVVSFLHHQDGDVRSRAEAAIEKIRDRI